MIEFKQNKNKEERNPETYLGIDFSDIPIEKLNIGKEPLEDYSTWMFRKNMFFEQTYGKFELFFKNNSFTLKTRSADDYISLEDAKESLINISKAIG